MPFSILSLAQEIFAVYNAKGTFYWLSAYLLCVDIVMDLCVLIILSSTLLG